MKFLVLALSGLMFGQFESFEIGISKINITELKDPEGDTIDLLGSISLYLLNVNTRLAWHDVSIGLEGQKSDGKDSPYGDESFNLTKLFLTKAWTLGTSSYIEIQPEFSLREDDPYSPLYVGDGQHKLHAKYLTYSLFGWKDVFPSAWVQYTFSEGSDFFLLGSAAWYRDFTLSTTWQFSIEGTDLSESPPNFQTLDQDFGNVELAYSIRRSEWEWKISYAHILFGENTGLDRSLHTSIRWKL